MAGTRHSAEPGDELCKIRSAFVSQWIYDWSMASRIRIGVQIAPQHSPRYSHIRDAVLRCEDLGVDIAFNWDHFFPLYGDPEGTHYECWTMLAAWAEQTSRIEMGALVTCNSYRNPDLLADMARTVDHISNGRLILGIGSGWNEKDYTEYGYDFGTAGSRLDDLAVALPRITDRLAKLNPAPNRHIPVLIGGTGERKTLRMVAQYADIWHGFVDGESYPRKAQVLADHCTNIGRDATTIERSGSVGEDTGDIDAVLAKAKELTKVGVTLLTFGVNGPDYDLSVVEALCRWRDQI
jgi:probable F420-dependent oxidoreductase